MLRQTDCEGEARVRHATARAHHRAWRRGGSVAARRRRRGDRMRRRELISPPASAAAHPTRANGRRAREQEPAMVASVVPVAVPYVDVRLRTLALVTIDSDLATEHLVLVYLLPTILIAIYFGSIVAVLTSFASGLAAAYFLLPPQFSFYIAEPRHVAELGFTVLLAVIASKVVAALAHDARRDAGAQPPQAR